MINREIKKQLIKLAILSDEGYDGLVQSIKSSPDQEVAQADCISILYELGREAGTPDLFVRKLKFRLNK